MEHGVVAAIAIQLSPYHVEVFRENWLTDIGEPAPAPKI